MVGKAYILRLNFGPPIDQLSSSQQYEGRPAWNEKMIGNGDRRCPMGSEKDFIFYFTFTNLYRFTAVIISTIITNSKIITRTRRGKMWAPAL